MARLAESVGINYFLEGKRNARRTRGTRGVPTDGAAEGCVINPPAVGPTPERIKRFHHMLMLRRLLIPILLGLLLVSCLPSQYELIESPESSNRRGSR